MEKIRPVMGKWWIRIKYDPWAHLNTITLYQRKKFASLKSISPLIQIWLSLGASETSCATNTMYIKCPPLMFSIPTESGRKKWFRVSILIEIFICRSEQLIPTQKSSIQVKLHSSHSHPSLAELLKAFLNFLKNFLKFAFVSELRKTKSRSCVRTQDSQLAFET